LVILKHGVGHDMIAVLYPPTHHKIAKDIAGDLADAFFNHVEVTLVPANSCPAWPKDAAWDDILILLYDHRPFPNGGSIFLTEYYRRRPDGLVLPVALGPVVSRPPGAAAGIKALEYGKGSHGPGGRLANRVGGMLGLRVQGRDTKIFVSYRATDGAPMAQQLYDCLLSLGHTAWLDEAKELDGETKVLPGSDIQREIDEALAGANLLLLIDTPSAPHSRWIRHEIETADALLLPIMPICFRDAGDQTRGPRFRSLLALQRWIEIERANLASASALGADQLERIVRVTDEYLCEIFRRKCRIPHIVEKLFVLNGFVWKVLDKRLLMFESSKGQNPRLLTKVLSHCSIFDRVYNPALRRFQEFQRTAEKSNYSLFIYDGELLPEADLREIANAQDDPVVILHHQELAALISSNFTKLAIT
jgi:hypothetical protein